MRAGRPVVAADAGGAREIVRHGVDGLLTPPGDVSALAVAVAGLLSDPGSAARLADAGRRTATEHFDLERCVSAINSQIAAVLGGKL